MARVVDFVRRVLRNFSLRGEPLVQFRPVVKGIDRDLRALRRGHQDSDSMVGFFFVDTHC